MKGHGDKISRKQEQAIAALLSHPTIPAAAEACEVSDVTLWRWMQEPGFKAVYSDARKQALESAIALLQKATGGAVATLINLMRSEDTPPAQRITACRSVLDFAFKGTELLDHEARLTALEERLMQQEQ